MKPSLVFTAVVALSGISSAWPWPPSFDDIRALAGLDHRLDRRQDGQGNNSDSPQSSAVSATASAPASTSVSASPAPQTSESGAQTTSGDGSDGTASPTSTGSASGTASNTNSRITAPASITSGAYPGGVNLMTPDTQFGGSQYYAVGTTATWVWNYTSLARTPAAIDVVATVASTVGGVAPSPFTLAANLSFDPTVTFKWDTGEYAQTSALPVGIYTLQVYDAANPSGVSAYPSPGKLAPFQAFKFGVYTPGPFFELQPVFQCATCNAAGGQMERLAWGTLVGFVGITLGTVAWFTGVTGLW